MHHKHYNQKNVTRNIWGKPDVSSTKSVKNITGISKLAAENKISQNNIQTTSVTGSTINLMSIPHLMKKG